MQGVGGNANRQLKVTLNSQHWFLFWESTGKYISSRFPPTSTSKNKYRKEHAGSHLGGTFFDNNSGGIQPSIFQGEMLQWAEPRLSSPSLHLKIQNAILFSFFPFQGCVMHVCVCDFWHMLTCIWLHIHVHVCGDPRLMSGIILYRTSMYSNPELPSKARVACQLTLRIPWRCLPRLELQKGYHACPSIYASFWNPNSSPLACKAKALATEQPPALQIYF